MSAGRKALVLGGGGITGIAWEMGVLAGLVHDGIDLTSPDLVVGTSAGSLVGAQLLGGTPIEELYAEELKDANGEVSARIGAGALARFVIASIWPGDGRRGRAYLGRAAMAARRVPAFDLRTFIDARLHTRQWPERQLLITAVDAETGEARVFDRDSGVALTDAVTASCSVPLVWPPMTINGRPYIDGGVRSIVNADLAADCDHVVVLAPVTVAFRRSGRIASQLASLGAGVRSVVVSPDADSRKAIGRNVLDLAHRAASASAGRRQAGSAASAVRAVWSDG